jgi:hypothetical protein
VVVLTCSGAVNDSGRGADVAAAVTITGAGPSIPKRAKCAACGGSAAAAAATRFGVKV